VLLVRSTNKQLAIYGMRMIYSRDSVARFHDEVLSISNLKQTSLAISHVATIT